MNTFPNGSVLVCCILVGRPSDRLRTHFANISAEHGRGRAPRLQEDTGTNWAPLTLHISAVLLGLCFVYILYVAVHVAGSSGGVRSALKEPGSLHSTRLNVPCSLISSPTMFKRYQENMALFHTFWLENCGCSLQLASLLYCPYSCIRLKSFRGYQSWLVTYIWIQGFSESSVNRMVLEHAWTTVNV